jgi:hypothetical protein
MVRTLIATVVAGLTLIGLSGCGLDLKPGAEPKPSRVPATEAAPAYLDDPKAGECHDLTLKDIAAPSDTKKPVPCSEDHTTLTVAVVPAPEKATKGPISERAYAVGEVCGEAFKKVLGGDSKTRVKTLYSLAWFMPTKAQAAKGAEWMRCDVTLSDQHRAYLLKGKQPLLDDGATERELRCGRNEAGNRSWEFVPCTTKHQYVPRTFIEADEGTTFEEAEKEAEKACFAERGLFSWSLPEQWGVGDRWYICWETVEEEAASNVVTLERLAATPAG